MKRWLRSSGTSAFTVALLTASLAGCASGPPRDLMQAGRSTRVQLTVQNNDFKDATIYARWFGSARRRVGMVTGKTSRTFTFDWQSEVVQLEADFVAGGTLTVEPIDVSEGDHLHLVILDQG